MSRTSKKKFRIPLRSRLKRRLIRLPPLIIWGFAVAGAVALYLRQEQMSAVKGFAAEVRYTVASEVSGRLKRLEVSLHQEVAKGQVVAALDEAELQLDLHESRAELERIRAELSREGALFQVDIATYKTDWHTQLRRFTRDAENARIDYLAGKAELATDKISLQGLVLNYDRSRALAESEYAPLEMYDQDRVAREALEEKIAGYEPTLVALEERWHESESRFDRFVRECAELTGSEDVMLRPFEYALRVQEIRIEKVNLAITQLVLRAPAAGCVTKIFKRSGEALLQGEAVVSILDPRSNEILAYVAEENILRVEQGSSVTLRRKADPKTILEGTVAFLGEEIGQLPVRLNPMVTVPRWGLAVTISLPDSMWVKPGEAFDIFF